MEHVHEPSDDSYCTTDEGNSRKDDGEEPYSPISEDKIGEELKINEDKILKYIEQIGTSLDKPFETDNVIVECSSYYYSLEDTNKEIQLNDFCKFDGKTEYNLSEDIFPRSLSLAISSMREGEISLFKIKFNFIFRFIDKDLKDKKYYENKFPPEFLDKDFRTKYANNKICFRVKLIKFYMIRNLYDNSEIQKKILVPSKMRKNFYATDGDIVTYNMKCFYKQKEIYNKEQVKSDLDCSLDEVHMLEIEHRILENIKIGEQSIVTVLPQYMSAKNKLFLEKYNIDNTEPIQFFVEVFDIEHYEYVYNIKKDRYSKTKLLHEGFGDECPDREMHIKLKLQIKINGEIKYNSFGVDNIIKDYLPNNKYTDEVKNWREEMNKKYDIKNMDEDVDYEKDGKIFDELNFPGLITIDMKNYTFPILLRKVLVHMKRNEIKYIKSTFLDYFFQDNCELYNIGTFNVDDGKTKIEIYIHLYDFKHVKSYYKLNYEEKYENLVKYKKRADECFKKGTQAQIYRAMKIYHNLNYRFDEGDVFGSEKDKEEEKLKNEKKELYENLVKMRINVHNNFALCKFKLGKIYSCYEAASKTLTIDDKNPKALFLHGKSCLMLNFYKPAVDSLRKLKALQPDNHDIDDTLKEAEKKYNNDLEKERNMFKKMFKSSGSE